MVLGAAGVTQGVAGYVEEVFSNTGPRLLEETGEVVRDGVPIPGYIIPAIGIEVARRACRRYADNAGVFDPATAAGFERLCRPYLDDVGYGDGPTIDLPFRGGQCAGTNYRIQCQTTVFPTANCTPISNAFSTFVNGPVSGPFTDSVSPPPAGPLCPGTSGTRVFMRTGPNQDILVLAGASYGARISGLSVTRNSGPDDCGNPPPVITDPVPPTVPDPPGPQPFNPGPEIDIDIDVDIDIDPVVGPVIVFDIGTGPITIDPFPEGEGGDGGGGDGGGSGPPPGDVGEPAGPEDTGEDDKASGCAPEGSVLAGLKINLLEPLPQVSQYDDQVWRGACYVYMGVPGNLALHPEGVALRDGQFFLPQVDNLTCYEVRANTGFNLRVTPYYRALES